MFLKRHDVVCPYLHTLIQACRQNGGSLYGRPHLDRVRQECAADLRGRPPAKIIALGISPPRGAGDDDAWEALCNVFRSLPSVKEYWTMVPEHREQMAAYGFEPRYGYFNELLAAL